MVSELREALGVNRPLKPLTGRVDDPPLPPTTLAFVEWAARYACEPPGEALALALRGLRAPAPRPERLVRRHRRRARPDDPGARPGAGSAAARGAL